MRHRSKQVVIRGRYRENTARGEGLLIEMFPNGFRRLTLHAAEHYHVVKLLCRVFLPFLVVFVR